MLQPVRVFAVTAIGRAAGWLDSVHLPEPRALLARYPHELSGGQCQRVLIGLAFASKPALVIADEPTSALDVVTQAHIMRTLAEEQRAYGTAVLLITHDLRLAAHVCDDVAVMYAGDVVERGRAGDVLRRPRHPYTRSLRDAEPPLDGPLRELPPISEFMPGLRAMAELPGCRFAARCPTRDPACATRPPLIEPAPGHFVLCVSACLQDGEERPPAPRVGRHAPPLAGAVPILEFDRVSLTYARPRGLLGARPAPVHAVRPSSFKVFAGETLGIVGESGSGKSSIARLALGLERPTSGRIALDGQAAPDRRAGVQIVFQDPQSALNPRRRVLRLVTQPMEAPAHAAAPAARLARALELLRETGLPQDCLERFPGQLSGGQRQRVNIGRALCVTPRLLVADEIVSGLDVSVQSQILNLLARLTGSHGLALLFISHDLSVIRYLCARVLVMYRGEIVESGPTEELFAHPRHPYTRTLLAAVPPDDPDRAWPPPLDVLDDGRDGPDGADGPSPPALGDGAVAAAGGRPA